MVINYPLTVYKASAGSGKTFTLAVEYIKLLVENPQSYRQTLAVTFTNKATEEMKMRILSQLYGIWRNLEDSADYTNKVCKELKVTPEYASQQAGHALRLMLHNYSYFRVETIDSFFQSVLRNLARELELTANLRVGLNDTQVEEQAVDELIDSLQATDLMLQWLLRYIMDTISDDHSWNVIGKVKKFGETIFRDYYKKESRNLQQVFSQNDFFDNYSAILREERTKAREHMHQIAETFFDTIEAEGLNVDDFSGKSRGVCSIFIKMRRGEFDESIANDTVNKALGAPSKWYTKTSPNAQLIHSLVETELNQLLRYALEEQPRQWRRFKSADLTLRHLSQMRLLGSIEARVRQLNETANRFLLSDTQQLLHDLIDGSDSPFIFEKIGAQLEHIMIDEFQDTSTVQWKNFKVLLEEAMSHEGSSNLIVGDVKQSIYRWRSGDWRLLANIKSEFGSDGRYVRELPLDMNYRSAPNIVAFNNAFFEEAASQEAVDAYGDVSQQWPEKKEATGLVSIDLLPNENYDTGTLEAVASRIGYLLEQGAHPGEIAILLRSNKLIPVVANYLTQQFPDISVVSEEAFRLEASPAVQVIVQALRYLLNPADVIAKAFLIKTFSGRLDGELPEDLQLRSEELLRQPLYNLTEHLYGLFAHNPALSRQSAYLCAFFDQVATFASDQAADAATFIAEWDESLHKKTIQSPELNGIRIISIHKSKGLEFDHVIIPFCDWRLEQHDIIWCRPQEPPYNQLPLVPIDYSQKGMKGTIYERDYEEEHRQNVVDNLNLLYVAFTRASCNLFVMGKRSSKGSRSALIESVVPALKLKGATLSADEGKNSPMHFEFGTLFLKAEKQEKDQPNPFLRKSVPVDVDIATTSHRPDFRQSNKSQTFAAGDDEQATGSTYIQLGSVLHNIFSTIRTTADIPRALRQIEQEGIIYDRTLTRSNLETMIAKRLENPRVADWFSPRWTLYNECTILSPDGQERRPDRVMTDGQQTIVVDFKFGRQQEEHHDQVREYMNLLQQMGNRNVSGFLWYVYSNKIVKV